MEAESKELQVQREDKKAATKKKFKALEKKLGDNDNLVRYITLHDVQFGLVSRCDFVLIAFYAASTLLPSMSSVLLL